MSNWVNKRRIAILLLTAMVWSLTACGQSGTTEAKMTTYTMGNGLEIVYQDSEQSYIDDNGCEMTINRSTIKGLKDTQLEQKINQRIDEKAQALLQSGLPAYRGIKVKIPDNAVLERQMVDVYISGNFNDILSVAFHKGSNYLIPEREYSEYIAQTETLNIDLHTGNEITLAELFPDGTDYLALLNEAVQQELERANATEEEEYSFETLKLVAPFAGVRPDHKFSVSPGGLLLYLDQDTPEFELDSYGSSIYISNTVLWQAGPFAQRFYDPKAEIYTGEIAVAPELLHWQLNDDAGIDEWNDDDERLWVSANARYSTQLPQVLQDEINALTKVDDAMLERVKTEMAKGGSDSSGYYDAMVSAYRYGDLYIIERYENASANDWFQFTRNSHVYDANSLEQMTLSQLFKADYDYQAVLRNKIVDAQYDLAVLDEPYNWSLSTAGVTVSFDLENNKDLHVPFSDFGMDHMTIFY